MTDEMTAMRKRQDLLDRGLEDTKREHDETKRLARAAQESSSELEGRALVAIATLTQTQVGHGSDIKEIKRETSAQTLSLAKILTGVRLVGIAAAASPVLVGTLWWFFQQLQHH